MNKSQYVIILVGILFAGIPICVGNYCMKNTISPAERMSATIDVSTSVKSEASVPGSVPPDKFTHSAPNRSRRIAKLLAGRDTSVVKVTSHRPDRDTSNTIFTAIGLRAE